MWTGAPGAMVIQPMASLQVKGWEAGRQAASTRLVRSSSARAADVRFDMFASKRTRPSRAGPHASARIACEHSAFGAKCKPDYNKVGLHGDNNNSGLKSRCIPHSACFRQTG